MNSVENPKSPLERVRASRDKRMAQRAQAKGAIVAALAALGRDAAPEHVAEAIMTDQIPHVRWSVLP